MPALRSFALVLFFAVVVGGSSFHKLRQGLDVNDGFDPDENEITLNSSVDYEQSGENSENEISTEKEAPRTKRQRKKFQRYSAQIMGLVQPLL